MLASMTPSGTALSTGKGRILPFDLLRGVCAIGVACFHLLSWQEIVKLDAIGLYGVYLFFVLSGASITMAYAHKLHTLPDFGAFMAIRYLRLAPLYLLVLAAAMAYRLVAKSGDALAVKLMHLLPNLTLLFGFGNPGASSLVVGGWSLGIEFLFYLLFPVFLIAAALVRDKPLRAWGLLLLTLLIQQGFINYVLQFGAAPFAEQVFAYTQFAAFLAYFAGGCAIGHWLLAAPHRVWPSWLWLPALAMLALLFADYTSGQSTLLSGAEGVWRALLAIAIVLVWSRLPVGGMIRGVAGMLGDASYGIYLLHPVVFHLVLAARPAERFFPHLDKVTTALLLSTVVILVSLGLSLAFHRLIEIRVLHWGKGRFRFGGPLVPLRMDDANRQERRP